MPRRIVQLLIACCLLTIACETRAAVGIGVFLKKGDEFVTNAKPEYYISGFNNGATPRVVDVHVGIIRNGVVYEYPDWNQNLTPWLHSFSIPANYRLAPLFMGSIDGFPGGMAPGVYKLAVALTEPGTLNLLAFEFVPFVVYPANQDEFDVNLVVLGHGYQPANGDTAVDAAGAFGHVYQDPSRYVDAVAAGTPTIDQCILTTKPGTLFILPIADLVSGTTVASLDAGATLRLDSPKRGAAGVPRDIDTDHTVSYLQLGIANGFYHANEAYFVSGTGGPDVRAFAIGTTSPPRLVMTQPSNVASLRAINAGQDLVIGWQGNNGIGEVEIALWNDDFDEVQAIVCRFADDGQGVIPSNLLSQLRARVGTQADLSMALQRARRNIGKDNAGMPIEFRVIDVIALDAGF